MDFLQELINRYKAIRSRRQLSQTYGGGYAFVGLGGHSTSNLYPVLDYLRVPIKYICVKSPDKVGLISRKYQGVQATTSLQAILEDPTIKGVFVSVSPSAHFSIARQVMQSGKSLFIEKPPCPSLSELQELAGMEESADVVTMVGMQKRFSPLTQTLKKRLRKDKPTSYNLRYLTGAYPEGEALFDLFIHPLDLVCFLFGKAEVRCVEKSEGGTYLITLKHKDVIGLLELSTAYSWTDAKEEITINAEHGIYNMSQMEELTFTPKQGVFLGVPMEKVFRGSSSIVTLYSRNNFTPTIPNNQIVAQGYYSEIASFVNSIERHDTDVSCSFASLINTYELINSILKLNK